MVEKKEYKASKIASLEAKLRDIAGMPVNVRMFSPMAAAMSDGSAPDEETGAVYVNDRAVKIEIDRNDNACEWAYENDITVSNSIDRICNITNNGLVEKTKDDSEEAKAAKALLERKRKSLKINMKIDALIKYRKLYGYSALKKTVNASTDILGLVELDTHEDRLKPIRNLQTGELGGNAGAHKNIAFVQKGNEMVYDEEGTGKPTPKNFYLKREEVVPWPSSDRGKFKGTSDVKRTLRYVEIKSSIVNSVDLIIKRFGPQIWIIVGNKDVNFSNVDLPQSYTRDGSGNLIDKATALETYKTERFKAIESSVKKWADGEVVVQMAEYGMEPKTFTPNANLFNYSKFIDLFSDYIKVGIFGLDVAGRVDVTSSLMLEGLFREIKDKVTKEREQLIDIINEEIAQQILKAYKMDPALAWWEFKPLDKKDELNDALIEFRKSQTALNYMNATGMLPEYLTKKWEIVWDKNTPKQPAKPGFNNETPGKPFGKAEAE